MRDILSQLIEWDGLRGQKDLPQAGFDPRASHVGIKGDLPAGIPARLQHCLEEPFAFPLMGRFDQSKKTHLILYRAMVETAYHHIWLVLRNFSIELEEVSNPLSHFGDSKGRIRKPWLSMRSACRAQLPISRLHKYFSQLILRRFIPLRGKQLLPFSLLFSSEGTC